jgi:Dual specificity phosphatase, catalytic domain
VVPERLLAGEHPGAVDEREARDRIRQLRRAGIDFYIDLTEIGERPEYRHLLPHPIEYLRSPIGDTHVPANVSQTQQVLYAIREALSRGRRVYVHCRAGIGRTGLIIGCFLAEEEHNGRGALRTLNRLWRQSARSETWPRVPQTAEQADYIRHWPRLRARAGKA